MKNSTILTDNGRSVEPDGHNSLRRELLRTTFAASVFAATCGSSTLLGNVLPDSFRDDDGEIDGDVKNGATITGIYTMRFSDFTLLRNRNGSVRLKVPGAAESLGQIIVTRFAENSFSALNEACPHAGCAVGNFAGGQFICPCHGSAFNGEGRRLLGPARSPLPSYPTTYKAGDDFVQVDIPGLVTAVKDDVRSLGASLEQNYPNPVNGTTSIEYSLGRSAFVSIVLLSLLGKEVMEIVRKDHDAGQYRASVDVSGLSRGVYLYRMDTSGGFSQTRKLTIV
jgi:Rieske Fe-S protein